jgi:hypothetical protein
MTQYKLEIDKIEPQTDEYMKIALNGKSIIQDSIKNLNSIRLFRKSYKVSI